MWCARQTCMKAQSCLACVIALVHILQQLLVRQAGGRGAFDTGTMSKLLPILTYLYGRLQPRPTATTQTAVPLAAVLLAVAVAADL